jgi:hypothetical protein
MALLTRQTAQATAARVKTLLDPAAVRDRFAERVNATPGRLTAYLVVLGLLGVLTGISAVVGVGSRSDLVDAVATRSGPLAVQAQLLYRSLSDADATAAAAFLSSGSEPPALRARYQSDIAAASAALAAAGGATAGGAGDAGPVADIAASLPVYTGLIETARTYNRQNLPVGAAYLREASTLMRDRLLPAADQLYRLETERLAGDRDGAAAFPWLTVPLILLTLAGLVVAQVYLVRRTRRLVNVGLATATAAGAVLLLWVGLSWIGAAVNLNASDRDGSGQVEVLAQARIAALQARADEALTLVARGSGGAFEDDFNTNMTTLAGEDGQGGLLARAQNDATDPAVSDALADAVSAVTEWRTVHTTLRGLDDAGQYPDAVKLAIGTDGSSAAAFNRVDDRLAAAIATASRAFDEGADSAGGALVATGFGWSVLTLVLVAGVVVGLQQRIAEYR